MAAGSPIIFKPLLQSLQQTLAGSVFTGFSGHLQIPDGADVTREMAGQQLEELTRLIAGKDPNTATQLLPLALEARTSKTANVSRRCFKEYSEIIERATESSQAENPLVDFDVLYEVSCKIVGPDKEKGTKWINKGLKRLRVPTPASLLSVYLRDYCRGPFVIVKRTRKTHFVVKYIEGYSRRGTFEIGVPYTVTKALTQDQLQYLIAKALMTHVVHHEGGRDMMLSQASVHPDELNKETPLSILTKPNPMQLIQLGPPDFGANASEWIRASLWLHRTLPVFNYYVSELSRGDKGHDFVRHFRNLDANVTDLLNIPNAARILGNCFSIIPPLPIWFAFQAEDSTQPYQGRPIGVTNWLSMKHGTRLNVTAHAETLSQLSGLDLIDLVVWSGLYRYHPQLIMKLGLSLESLRSNRPSADMSFEDSLHRAHIRYTYSHRVPKKKKKARENSLVEGDISEDAKLNFLRALGAVFLYSRDQNSATQVSWQHVLGIRQWVLKDVGLDCDKPFVESFQNMFWASLQVFGNADRLTPLDWLFLLSRMDSAPAQALRTRLDERDHFFGSRASRSANRKYTAVASEPAYASYGTHDPRLGSVDRSSKENRLHFYDNRAFRQATVAEQQEYASALVWFDEAGIPEAWKPLPTDSLAELMTKQRQIRVTWHQDYPRTTKEQAAFVRQAENYWVSIMRLHE